MLFIFNRFFNTQEVRNLPNRNVSWLVQAILSDKNCINILPYISNLSIPTATSGASLGRVVVSDQPDFSESSKSQSTSKSLDFFITYATDDRFYRAHLHPDGKYDLFTSTSRSFPASWNYWQTSSVKTSIVPRAENLTKNQIFFTLESQAKAASRPKEPSGFLGKLFPNSPVISSKTVFDLYDKTRDLSTEHSFILKDALGEFEITVAPDEGLCYINRGDYPENEYNYSGDLEPAVRYWHNVGLIGYDLEDVVYKGYSERTKEYRRSLHNSHMKEQLVAVTPLTLYAVKALIDTNLEFTVLDTNKYLIDLPTFTVLLDDYNLPYDSFEVENYS